MFSPTKSSSERMNNIRKVGDTSKTFRKKFCFVCCAANMDIFDSTYYKFNKNLHRCLGSWPYQSRGERYVIRCIIFCLDMTLIIPEISNLIQVRHDLNMIVDGLPILITQINHIAKYCSYIINNNEMMKLFDAMRQNWLAIQTDEERIIMHKYARMGRTVSFVIFAVYYGTLTLYLMLPISPRVLDALYPLNESRPLVFIFETDYMIDRVKYYTPICIHHYVIAVMAIASIVVADATYGVYAHHACGMFAIVRHQLDNMPFSEISVNNLASNEMENFKKIVNCIRKHQEAIRFCEMIESAHVAVMCAVLLTSITCLSIVGVQTVSHLDQPLEASRFAALCIGHFLHVYYHTWNCQQILNHSSAIHEAAYNAKWYTVTGKTAKLLKMIMVRSGKPCIQTAGKLFPLTLLNFTVIVKTSMSYFTVLTNVQ